VFPAPLVIVTVPVGVPAPGELTVTDHFTVYVCPITDGSGKSEVMAVVVLALFTVCVKFVEVLVLKFVSPL